MPAVAFPEWKPLKWVFLCKWLLWSLKNLWGSEGDRHRRRERRIFCVFNFGRDWLQHLPDPLAVSHSSMVSQSGEQSCIVLPLNLLPMLQDSIKSCIPSNSLPEGPTGSRAHEQDFEKEQKALFFSFRIKEPWRRAHSYGKKGAWYFRKTSLRLTRLQWCFQAAPLAKSLAQMVVAFLKSGVGEEQTFSSWGLDFEFFDAPFPAKSSQNQEVRLFQVGWKNRTRQINFSWEEKISDPESIFIFSYKVEKNRKWKGEVLFKTGSLPIWSHTWCMIYSKSCAPAFSSTRVAACNINEWYSICIYWMWTHSYNGFLQF